MVVVQFNIAKTFIETISIGFLIKDIPIIENEMFW